MASDPRHAVIRLDQTVHGYSSGHRRLAGSASLSPSADRLLSILSDLSGPALVQGFESYITGYPLPGSDYYVLAKTWYAAEMDRPGSVWTHSLLVPLSELSRIQRIDLLAKCFRRPFHADGVEFYEQPIEFAEGNEPTPLLDVPVDLLGRTIIALYDRPTDPVFLVASSADSQEPMLLRLWSQQWPGLRREFRFCTGSIEDRLEQGVRFDLQVIPRSAESKIARRSPNSPIIRELGAESLAKLDPWVEATITDLRGPSELSLGAFFSSFASDVPNPRGAFVSLAKVFVAVERARHHDVRISRVIDAVASEYPQREAGQSIKRGLFGGPSIGKREWATLSDVELLQALVTHPRVESFDPAVLEVSRRAAELYRLQPTETLSLLQRISVPPRRSLVEEFALGCLSVATADDIDWTNTGFSDEALPWILERAPRWLLHIGPWKSREASFDSLLRIVEENRAFFARDGRLPVALLKQGWTGDIARVLEILGPETVVGICRFIDSDQTSVVPSVEWLRALAVYESTLVNWLKREEAGISARWILAATLKAEIAAYELGPNPWVDLTRAELHPANPEILWRAIAFMYLVGLLCGQAGGELVGATFGPLHRALADNRLPLELWLRLESHLPRLSAWLDWDHCGRLRRSVINAFLEKRLELRHLLQALNTPDLFRSVIADVADSSDHRRFVQIFSEAASGSQMEIAPSYWEGIELLKRRSAKKWLWDWEI